MKIESVFIINVEKKETLLSSIYHYVQLNLAAHS